MSLLTSVKSLLGVGQKEEAFGFGQRYPLTKQMAASLRRHSNQLVKADLTGYKFERRHSDYTDANADLVIYDPNDKAVFHGREMGGGFSFWPME